MLAVFLISLFGLLLLGLPVGFTLILTSVIMMLSLNTLSFEIIAQSMMRGIDNFPLLAIPFFMLAGEIMNAGGLSGRIVSFAKSLVGFLAGGLGYVAVVASMIFAGISGSAIADTSAIGSVLLPIMKEEKYDMNKSTALIAAAGTIGPVIPPSIPMILYGVVAGESIVKLFLGGVIPGILIGLGLMFVWYFISKKEGYKASERISLIQVWCSFKEAFWALLLPVIILGGILAGIYTPTEAAVIAVVYALLVSGLIYRSLRLNQLLPIMVSTVRGTAMVLFVCGAATAAGYLMTVAQVPKMLAGLLLSISNNRYVILFLVNILLLLVGMVMDLTPALLILAPILLPVVTHVGVDPLFFGVIMVVNLCIGLITPPVGTVLFTACGLSKQKLSEVVRELMPFIAIMVAVLFLITYIPSLVMFIPQLSR
ncbi:TRAP transporter, DctM subunit [Thermanaeromonas toyohensis ToBE]|uniref:TRAP transporter, DctM subunit n=1 Tax=Thermanaeromonas toyohensis ToBE TaxID=698762 RepID=A0A1W1W036_9FIRM|nr:TRAP transporter large permease [Thermanaeromonas toyohensis]SMB98992.1 TRAP transporter, DctM subunit [Thermanaeromonas toyohensis ToBE]